MNPELVDPIPIETGAEWFARQSPDVQRRMLPSVAAYNAYKSGQLDLANFVGERHSGVWGTSVVARSGKRALTSAGLRPADFEDGPSSKVSYTGG